MHLPNDEGLKKVLDQLAADPWQMREMYEKYKQPDRRYAAYDFNPLFVNPIIRIWPRTENMLLDDDRMIAPLPGLILTRISEGIYNQMFHHYRDQFSKYFGHVFGAYIGEILRHSVPIASLLSEDEIRQTYPSKKGKVPDWVVIEGNTATLIECKATGYSRKALATADQQAVDYSLSQVVDGLMQLQEFRHACENRIAGLERFQAITEFKCLLVTFERFYIINSTLLKEIINQKLSTELSKKGIKISAHVTNWCLATS